MTDTLDQAAGMQVFGLSAGNIAMAVAVALLAYLAMSLTLRFLLGRLEKVAGRTANHIDDMAVQVLRGTSRRLMVIAAVLIGIGLLDLSERWSSRVGQLWFVALAMQVAVWLTRGIEVGLRHYEERHHGFTGTTQVSASATLMSWFMKLMLWAVFLLAVLSNLGVNITAFVASLGIGGVAVALAVQSILGDLFASLSIAVDKPFEVGDFIGVDSIEGTVQYVGLKTTRIQSISGEQIIMSNTDLLKQVVRNYKRMDERRVVFGFGLAYDVTADQAEKIPPLVKRLVEEDEKLRFSRAHLKKFGDSSLDFEVVYFVKDAAYDVYMDAQQRLNLKLMRELAAAKVEFSLPTQALVIPDLERLAPPDKRSQAAPANEEMATERRAPRSAGG